MSKARPIPEGRHTVTPHLVIRGAAEAIDFYKRAFGAVEKSRSPGPEGKGIMHAELKIGDSFIYLCDEFPGGCGMRAPQSVGGTTCTIHLFVEDCDAVFAKATAAGATVAMPLMDMFWGDRYGQLTDPFGHAWSVATHKEDLTPEEIAQRAKAAFAQMGKGEACNQH